MPQDETTRIRLGSSRYIDVAPGSMVIVRHGRNDSYGAVVQRIGATSATLTFTPRDRPREVPLGMILSAVSRPPATMNLSSVPRYQPEPTVTPRRRKRSG